jgi:TetR/AcrR family acrAB operon transcriptional repressor
MMQRVVLPMEAIREGADCCEQPDPLSLLRRSAIDVLLRTARDPKTRRVFEIAYHKCEYVGDAAGVRDRHVASRRSAWARSRRVRACVKGSCRRRRPEGRRHQRHVALSGLIALGAGATPSLEKNAEIGRHLLPRPRHRRRKT